MLKLSLLSIILLCTSHMCEAYKVLVLFPWPGKSHSFLGDGVVRHLLEAGHEVTYITPFPKARKQHASLREIDVSSLQRFMTEDIQSIEKLMNNEVDLSGLPALVKLFLEYNIALLEDENVVKLLRDPIERFDVVIIEWLFSEMYSGISAVYNCPYIWVSSLDPHWMVLKLIDDIPNPAYTADVLSNAITPFSFLQRLAELVKIVLGLAVQSTYVSSIERREYERLLVPIIRKRGHKVPDFEELRYNASLMLGNSHVSMGQPMRLPQNYKAVGGYHIDTNLQPLPDDLKKVLDNAKNGLIYFSMGSTLHSKTIPTELKNDLLKVFGELKQTVIWKFEEDLPKKPSNVHIVSWAPQHSILAHPNCVLFITHGGLLSTTETIFFGKPIIGIPVFGDQFNNVDRAVTRGFAKRVDISLTMASKLRKAITDILTDPSYTAKVKELSFIYHDRPVPPGKELAHWIQHVVKTRGAPHLRSPALLVPWYQKCYLDLGILLIATLYGIKLMLTKLIRSSWPNTQHKKKIH